MAVQYLLNDHLAMVCDAVRMDAYATAMRACVRPGDVVLDLGAGIGIFAFLACQLGASRVYAIETQPSIFAAQALARANGVDDRIVFIHGDSTEVTLDEPVDVVVADMRGTTPLFGSNVASMADARARLLRPGGRLVQRRDHLMVAPVSLERRHAALVGRWRQQVHGIDLSALARYGSQVVTMSHVGGEDLLGDARRWETVEYGVDRRAFRGACEITARRAGDMHGLAVWFEAELAGDVVYSSGPGGATIYGQAFLPLDEPIAVAPGERISCHLLAAYDGTDYQWEWSVEVDLLVGTRKGVARQTTLAPDALMKHKRIRDTSPR